MRRRRTTDRDLRKAREAFIAARKAERQFLMELMRVARAIEDFIHGMDKDHIPGFVNTFTETMRHYSDTLDSWAKSVAQRMALDVARRDGRMWRKFSEQLGSEIIAQMEGTPLGQTISEVMQDSAQLIKSLPLEAARKVEEWALETQEQGLRHDQLIERIKGLGDITRNRARLIARTEVARAAAVIAQERAERAGSEGYIWRTMGDADVREAHQVLEGKFFKWGDPPIAELGGQRHHPGCFPNCRCYAQVVFPKSTFAETSGGAEQVVVVG